MRSESAVSVLSDKTLSGTTAWFEIKFDES
jgi:hypothetical protein